VLVLVRRTAAPLDHTRELKLPHIRPPFDSLRTAQWLLRSGQVRLKLEDIEPPLPADGAWRRIEAPLRELDDYYKGGNVYKCIVCVYLCMCNCVMCTCVRACVRACVLARVRTRVHECECEHS
jgi:hypothetical protein